MNVSDILTLAKAGFTAEQIGKLMTVDAPAPVPAQAQAPAQAQEPAQAQAQAPAPVPAQAPDNTQAQFEKVFQQIANLTGIVQRGNIANAHQPDSQPLTAEDVLSEIIRPN
jgi:hypothetical protein